MSLSFFAALAGAVQMIAPDRWMQLSVLSWQKGWRGLRLALFSVFAYTAHTLLGLALFFALSRILNGISEEYLGIFSLLFLGLVGLVRAIRFSRPQAGLHPHGKFLGLISGTVALLGPSEMVIPVLMKAHMDGAHPLSALLPFWIGSCVAGFAVLSLARSYWNEPMALPRAMDWCRSRVSAIPMAAAALCGVVLVIVRVMA